MRPRNSPRPTSRLRPCRTSIFSPPRVKVLCASRTRTRTSIASSPLSWSRAPRPACRPRARPGRRTTTRSPAASPATTSAGSAPPGPRRTARRSSRSPATTHTCSAPASPRSAARGTRTELAAAAAAERLAQERHLDPHVRQDARIELVEADAHLDRRLLALGGGDGGDHPRRDRPVRVGVESGGHPLPRRHALDVRLVDVDLDLERRHVDDGRDAGAGEAAPGRDRRDHLARLGVLGDRDPGEGRADDEIVERLAGQRRFAPGGARLLALRARGAPPGPRPRPRSRRDRPARRCPGSAGRAPARGASCASRRRASVSAIPLFAAACRASASSRARRASLSSSRASTWPSSTRMPSSTSTSTTLPVTFDDTVAWRRAVT